MVVAAAPCAVRCGVLATIMRRLLLGTAAVALGLGWSVGANAADDRLRQVVCERFRLSFHDFRKPLLEGVRDRGMERCASGLQQP